MILHSDHSRSIKREQIGDQTIWASLVNTGRRMNLGLFGEGVRQFLLNRLDRPLRDIESNTASTNLRTDPSILSFATFVVHPFGDDRANIFRHSLN